MEKKLVVLTAAFALSAGLVFAQTIKDSGDEMEAETEVTENAAWNEENMEMIDINGELNAEMEEIPAEEVPAEAPAAE